MEWSKVRKVCGKKKKEKALEHRSTFKSRKISLVLKKKRQAHEAQVKARNTRNVWHLLRKSMFLDFIWGSSACLLFLCDGLWVD